MVTTGVLFWCVELLLHLWLCTQRVPQSKITKSNAVECKGLLFYCVTYKHVCTWGILLSWTRGRLPDTFGSLPKERYFSETSPKDLCRMKGAFRVSMGVVYLCLLGSFLCMLYSHLPGCVAARRALGIMLTIAMISVQVLSTLRNILDSAGSCLLMSGAMKILSRYSQFLWHVSHSSCEEG